MDFVVTQVAGEAPDNIEWALEQFKSLVPAPESRLNRVRQILQAVCGWDAEKIVPCDFTSLPLQGLRLYIGLASRVAIIVQEASLGLAGRNADRPYRLNSPVLDTPEAASAIRQACIVCGLKNCELAVVTNADEWIIFRGNRLGDGTDTLDGIAFLFSGCESIRGHFKLFFDLLSLVPVRDFRYRAYFQEAEGQPIRQQAFSKVLREAHSLKPLPRTSLALDIGRIMDSFFQRLAGDNDPDMLLKCFVTTRESQIAEDKIARISEDIVSSIRPLDTDTSSTLVTIVNDVQVTQRKEFVLLVGTKGAGKSTFVERFFKSVLDPKIRERCVYIQVDLKECPGAESQVVQWLDENLLKATENAMFEEAIPEYDDIQGMFHLEYLRMSKGSFKHLYELDKNAFKIEFGRHIESIRGQRPNEYICRILDRIVKSCKKAPCIIFDNADHFSIDFQQRVYQYARSIFERQVCLVIMPITDKTSWQLSRHGALESFEKTSLYLPTPAPKTVLEQRIKYLETKVSDDDEEKGRGYFLSQGIKLDLDHLKAFSTCLQHVFLETGKASLWVGNLANMDIRRSLELTRDIMASPYINVDELLKAYIARCSQVIPPYDIQRAIIRRNYNFYPVGGHPFVQNIFSLRTEIGTSPLLGLRILSALHNAQHTEEMGKESFVAVSQLYDYFHSITIERRVVALWLEAMLQTGLCWSYDPTHTSIDKVQKVELSPSGRQHLFWGQFDETYIGSMAEVTPVSDPSVFDTMKSAPRDNKMIEWYEKTGPFLKYLVDEDAKFTRIPDHPAFVGQATITKALDRVRVRLRRELDAHYSRVYTTSPSRQNHGIVRENAAAYGEHPESE